MNNKDITEEFKYIAGTYQVPAKLGARVKYRGDVGTVVGTSGHYLRILLDKDKDKSDHYPHHYHPTWEIEWLGNSSSEKNL